MGREIRVVPPNWQHPKFNPEEYPYKDGYQPMYEQNFEEAFSEWLSNFDRIRSGDRDEYEDCYKTLADWLEDYLPPKKEYYSNYKKEDCSWYQLYETVSEGDPFVTAICNKGRAC